MSHLSRPPRGQQRDKPYREALRMELAAAGEDMKKLREIARTHIEKAAAGDMQAIKELADRLDGKPAQALEHSGPDGEPITKVVNEIVHVYETREQIEFNDQTPLLEINPSKNGGNTYLRRSQDPHRARLSRQSHSLPSIRKGANSVPRWDRSPINDVSNSTPG